MSGNLPRFLLSFGRAALGAVQRKPAALGARVFGPFGLVVFLGLAAGCAPKIGDHCSISTDCSANGDRLCDTTQPGGYCTVFNCEPNGCPEEAICVAFNEKSCPDLTNGQSTAQQVRFQRTFCMATCRSDGDCRGGYVCLDTTNDPARRVLDTNPLTRSVCTVPPAAVLPEAAPPPDAPPPAVCSPTDASFSFADAGDAIMSMPDVSIDAVSENQADAPPEASSDASNESIPEGSNDDAAPDGSEDAAPDGADDGASSVEAGD